jgi:hypothetical protein
MAEIVFVGSKPKWLFKKKLSRDDLQKFYLPKQVKLSDLCPAALDSDSPNRFELFIYDSEKTGWQMTLRETSQDRWHLIGQWSQFADRWNLSEGQEIHFFEYTCNTGAKFLLICTSYREVSIFCTSPYQLIFRKGLTQWDVSYDLGFFRQKSGGNKRTIPLFQVFVKEIAYPHILLPLEEY